MNRKIIVDYLARVEGEGALHVEVKGNEVTDVRLRIFEPPRFFEAFLRGRAWREVPDLTARICGICPVAYQMSSIHAMENAFGVEIPPAIRALRRLLYLGEWIESHGLHVYMLHAPDFLGYDDSIALARDHPTIVKRALEMKKTGNALMAAVGGREIHPINARVGGFYRAPTREELQQLEKPLLRAREIAEETVKLVSGFDFPDFEQDYEFVALRHPDEYPVNEGHIVSNRGLDIPASHFGEEFVESHVAHSNALQCSRRGNSYLVGPMARYNLNFDRLTAGAKTAATAAGLGPTCTNPFKSIIVRAVEILYAVEESLRIIGTYEPPNPSFVDIVPRAGEGHACTEAPRGILYHRYRLDADGTILEAQIVPPTSQNQRRIEDDLRRFVQDNLHLEDVPLTHRCEQAVRNYDPCISCATHFLRLEINRT